MTGTYRYVRHEEVADWEKSGWKVVADLYPPHSDFSVLMKYDGPDFCPIETADE